MNNTFSKRLKVKIEQLKIYSTSVSKILRITKNQESIKKLKTLEKQINQSILLNEKILVSLSKSDFLDNTDEFKKISNMMFKKEKT